MISVTNELATVSIETWQVVEPILEEYVTLSSSESSKPVPWTVNFSVTNMHQDVVAPVGMRCDVDFGDNSTEIHELFVLTSGVITHEYVYDAAQLFATLFCENHVSNITYSTDVILREPITGLQIVSGNASYATDSLALFTISMDTGSHVLVEVNFNDGSELQSFTYASIYASLFELSVGNVYTAPENYTVLVSASNEFYSDYTELTVPVIIQEPVPPLVLTATEDDIILPPGIAEFQVTLSDNTRPTSTFCEWTYDSQSVDAYFGIFLDGPTDDREFVYSRSHVGVAVNVSVLCYNLVSRQNDSITIRVHEEIQNLTITLLPPAVAPSQNFTISVTVDHGSDITYVIRTADNVVMERAHPRLFAVDSAVQVSHSHDAIGNYTIAVAASNVVSSADTSVDIVVQTPIDGLVVAAASEVLWPDDPVNIDIATVHFSVTSTQPELLQNVHCAWDYDNEHTEHVYIDALATNETAVHTYQYDFRSVGVRHDVTVNCSNLISHQVLNHTVEVVWDRVILDDFNGGSHVWRTNVSTLNLTLQRFGSHSCFTFDVNDTNDNVTYFYGRPWCAAQEPDLQLEIIDDNTMEILVNHTYLAFGVYDVSVYAFNHVSNQTMHTTTVVKPWYCFTPNITFAENLTDTETLTAFYKSIAFDITPAELEIDCMKSYNQSVFSWKVRQRDATEVSFNVTTAGVSSFHHPVRMEELPYGQYEIELFVAMTNFEEYNNSALAYFEIIPTPLIVSINGRPSLNVLG